MLVVTLGVGCELILGALYSLSQELLNVLLQSIVLVDVFSDIGILAQ
jgi:hypothetical protein